MRRFSKRVKNMVSGSSSSQRNPASPGSAPSTRNYQVDDDEMMGEEAPRILLTDEHLDLRGRREQEAFNLLKDRSYSPTRAYDPDLLTKIGMDRDFSIIWNAIGWNDLVPVNEASSRLLTIQFLCTLNIVDDGISFRFFRKEYSMSWRQLSSMLGFSPRCALDLKHSTSKMNKHDFWQKISGEAICRQPRTNNIHNPTLRLMHKWLAMTLFPREDYRTVREDELKLLFAMVKKIKVSPVQAMMKQWLENIKLRGPVECTSLITRIANKLGLLDDAQISYLTEDRSYIGEDYLIAGHILKRGPNNSLIYFFPGFVNEIPLPNADYHLYKCQVLTIPLRSEEEARRSSVSGMLTRSRSRNDAPEMTPPPRQQSPFYTGTGPFAAGSSTSWDHAIPLEAGVSTPQQWGQPQQWGHPAQQWGQPAQQWGQSTQQWGQQGQWGLPTDQWGQHTPAQMEHSASSSGGPPPYRAARRSYSARSSRDYGRSMADLTQQVDDLSIRVGHMAERQEEQHAHNLEWQDRMDARLDVIQQNTQRNYDASMAYFHHRGFFPYQ